jgi:hypothetical protein
VKLTRWSTGKLDRVAAAPALDAITSQSSGGQSPVNLLSNPISRGKHVMGPYV